MTPAASPDRSVSVGHLVNKVDFERLLSTRSWGRSAHFSVHHVKAWPAPGKRASKAPSGTELSTGLAEQASSDVDNFSGRRWLGCVVPKRHARRAVTRNLLRRQIRAAFEGRSALLPAGLWLVRLREPYAKLQFRSAASDALKTCARTELDALLSRRIP